MSEDEDFGCSNLPVWGNIPKKQIAAVYSKAYRELEKMARNGHVTPVKNRKGETTHAHVSEEMKSLIEALDKGDENKIKGILMERLLLESK